MKLFRRLDKYEVKKKISIASDGYWCSPRLFKILYSSMILLLWVCGLYLCRDQEGMDQNKKMIVKSIIIPIMCCTFIILPFIIYIGGCVVALPDACKDAFPSRTCCLVSSCCENSVLASSASSEEEGTPSSSSEGEEKRTSSVLLKKEEIKEEGAEISEKS